MAFDLKIPLTDQERSCPKLKVCVTGSTGYIGAHLIQRLLAVGHTVHATARKPDDDSKVGHLRSLPNADSHLVLFKGDLLDEGSFDDAVRGCDVVVHAASPYIVQVSRGKEQEKVIDPALKGTENILNSVNKTSSVKRVVLTSSVAALYGDPHEQGPDHAFNDKDWGTVPTATYLPYFYSKKIAEQRAWEMAKQQSRWKLVTVLPGQVWGPPIAKRADSESVKMMVAMLSGSFYPAVPPIGMGFVDVRDVALVHSLAIAQEDAHGRYIAVSTTMSFFELAQVLRKAYPHHWVPFMKAPYYFVFAVGPFLGMPRDLVSTGYGKRPQFDTSKVQQEMGVNFISGETMILDEAQRLIELGMVKK